MQSKVTAVVLAAGEGTRMTSPTPKVLLEISGRSVVERAVDAFEQTPEVASIVVVAHPELIPTVAALLQDALKVAAITPGGLTRVESTRAGLEAIPETDGIVLIHDAARPLVTPDMISRLVAVLADAEAATVAAPARDTMLRVHDGRVRAVPDRSGLWHAQTPQGFRLSVLRAAHAAAHGGSREFTDDCGIVLHHLPETVIHVVSSSEENLKITRLGDIRLAEAVLAARREPA